MASCSQDQSSIWVLLMLLLMRAHLSLTGCCNSNIWCDGDPSFILPPDVNQDEDSTDVTVTFSDGYLSLAKCADYFFVRVYAPDASLVSAAPVMIERKQVLNQWEDSVKPFYLLYTSLIPGLLPDTEYTFQVVAVDKGIGWGDAEGAATAHSQNVTFTTRRNETMTETSTAGQLEPSLLERLQDEGCHELLCRFVLADWLAEVAAKAQEIHLRYHDPEVIPKIDLRGVKNGRQYVNGRLHGLSDAKHNVSRISLAAGGNQFLVNMTVDVPLLRTSYVWYSFIAHGVLQMFHTCGNSLPKSFFSALGADEVRRSVGECSFRILVELQVNRNLTQRSRAVVKWVRLVLEPAHWKLDLNWFTASYHNRAGVWARQREIIQSQLRHVVGEAYRASLEDQPVQGWMEQLLEQHAANVTAAATAQHAVTAGSDSKLSSKTQEEVHSLINEERR